MKRIFLTISTQLGFSLFIILFFVFNANAQEEETEETLQVRYVGELIDSNYVPISGVFPLTFSLYETPNSTEPVWNEQQYVSIYEGTYRILLGTQTTLETSWEAREMMLAIQLGELGEVVRQSITLTQAFPIEVDRSDLAIEEHIFVDQALYAVTSDTVRIAQQCQRFNGHTLAELDRFDEMLLQVAELRGTLTTEHRAELGRETQTTRAIGGDDGGRPYEVNCPRNHVVTAFRGNAGDLINAIRIVCRPLQ